MPIFKILAVLVAAAALLACAAGRGMQGMNDLPSTKDRPLHQQSAQRHAGPPPPELEPPPLPEGMTFQDVFDYAASPPPPGFPDSIADDELMSFFLIEQLEYRFADDKTRDEMGWEAQGWLGYDFDRLWLKTEGEAVFDQRDEGESETDLLYSRLITPFWFVQAGVQYANSWDPQDYDARWSGVIALQGLAPYMFELDNSLYFSEDGDMTFQVETEYDLRISQRLVLQPRAELHVAFQDVRERDLGAGLTDVSLDARLRYEFKREFAPYIGVQYRFLTGETDRIAERKGMNTERLYFVTGLRLAF